MLRIIILFVFFISCKTEPIRQEIEVGKTIKIFPSNFEGKDNDFIFLWSSPNGPQKSNAAYKIEKNIMLFTPDIKGDYEIFLTIESQNNNSIYEETFLFEAILKENSNYNNKTISNKDYLKPINKVKEKNKINENNNKKFTIQVASWPTLEQARKDQIYLRENGYDAYTEQFYIKSKDQLWWRVRVGNFSNKKIAVDVKNKLSKIKGNDLWIDFIE
tara:strand:- start:244 stop:891 length:648 start_codon:yes stop_codon:yes gene_type:complete